MALRQLTDMLERENVRFARIKHSPAYTASEIAQSAHIPGKELAKAVIVKWGDRLAMVVLSANEKINLNRLQSEIGSKERPQLATERDFKDKFPGCEVGAMPPFGEMFGIDVYMDEHLLRDKRIAFNAGSHTELIEMELGDFLKLVHPTILHAA